MVPSLLPSLTGTTLEDGRLLLLDSLGHGAFGSVYLARDFAAEGHAAYVAVKAIPFAGLTPDRLLLLSAEVNLHRRVAYHPNVVTLHRAIKTEAVLFLVLDLIPGPDLFDQIVTHDRYARDDGLITAVFAQIVDAVAACHKNGFAHRDLKPENILCEQDGTRVFLADFGLATTDRTSKDWATGSGFYMSPECRNELYRPYSCYSTAANDVWSCGIILITLITGVNPWCEASIEDASFRSYLARPDEYLRATLPVSEEAVDLLLHILHVDPTQRITIRQLARSIKHVKQWKRLSSKAGPHPVEDNDDGIKTEGHPGIGSSNHLAVPDTATNRPDESFGFAGGMPTPPTSPYNELPPVFKPAVQLPKPTLALPLSPPASPVAALAGLPVQPAAANETAGSDRRDSAASVASSSEGASALGFVLSEYLSGAAEDADANGADDHVERGLIFSKAAPARMATGSNEGSYFPSFPPAELEFPAKIEHELRPLKLNDDNGLGGTVF